MNGKISANVQDTIKETLRLQCITIFIEAYNVSMSKNTKEYDNDWEEDQFTAYLFQYMEDQPIKLINQWFIAPQTPIYTKEISSGQIHPNKAKRPDIKFEKYHSSFPKPFVFYIEAKNISEKDWQKKCGSKVEDYEQRARYIDTGIKHFKESVYPDGCLAGYVVQEKAHNIVNKLNELLKKRRRKAEILIMSQFIDNFETCYISTHLIGNNSIHLKHIFLDFVTA